jgi:hypothetical protein
MGCYLFHSKDTELWIRILKHRVTQVLKQVREDVYVGIRTPIQESVAMAH